MIYIRTDKQKEANSLLYLSQHFWQELNCFMFLFCADERDVCKEQHFLSDGLWPAEYHGRARGSMLAGHSAASPAHREGKVKPRKCDSRPKRQTSPLKSLIWTVQTVILTSQAVSSMTSLAYDMKWPARITIPINDLVIIWPDAEIFGFLPACTGSKTPHPLEFGDITNPPTHQLQRPEKQMMQFYCYYFSVS